MPGMTGVAQPALETLTCPLACGATAATEVGVRSGHRLARCLGCAHLFAINLPTDQDLDHRYVRYSYDTNGLSSVSALVLERLGRVLAGLEAYRRSNRLLDVGFGAGAVLLAAQRRGWDVFGIERSALAAEQAQANGFVHAVQGDFLEAPLEPASFDVVVMTELIEHLPHPLPFLARAYEVLRPGGALYLTTPNGAGMSGRVLGARWSVVCPPEHLNLFSPRSLTGALTRAGLRPVRLRTEALNPYELLTGIRERLSFSRTSPAETDGVAVEPEHQSVALNETLMSTTRGRVLKSVVNRILDLTHMGDSLKVVAERPPSS